MSDLPLRIIITAQNNSSSAFQQMQNAVHGVSDELGSANNKAEELLNAQVDEAVSGWEGALNGVSEAAAGANEQFLEQIELVKALVVLRLADLAREWASGLIVVADGYQTLNAKLGLLGGSEQEQIAVQQELFEVAQNTYSGLRATQDVYIANVGALKELGGTTAQALAVTETLNKAIALTSQGLQQDQAALDQWGQAIGNGVLNGDELVSIMSNSLGLSKAIADGMGVPIGKLKELGAQGKLTSATLFNALLSAKAGVDTAFASIPATVAQSMTLVSNAWSKYIGETNQAFGATRTLAEGLEMVAENLPALIEIGIELTAIYGVKLVAGLTASIDAHLAAAAATEAATTAALHAAIVNKEELRIKALVATASKTAAEAMEIEAHYQLSLAVTAADTAAAQTALAAATQNVTVATLRAASANYAYINATTPVPPATTLATIATKALNGAFWVLAVAWAGWEIGGFLRKLEWVRMAGTLVAEGITDLIVVTEHFFSGDLFTSGNYLADKLAQVHRGYGDVRKAATDEAEHEQAIAAQKTERLAQDKIIQKEAFKELQAQLKDTTALIEAEYSRQTDAITRALDERKTAIIGSAASEINKEIQISQLTNAANTARLLAIQQTGDKKLQLLDSIYGKELLKLKAGTVEQEAIERQSIEERIDVYNNLERNYQGIINALIQDDQRHAQAAAALANERELLEQDTQAIIRTIRQGGMTDEQLLADKKKQLEESLSAERKALAEGDTENARRYGEQAAKTAQELGAQAAAAYKAGVGYSSDADKFISKFKQAREGIGEAISKEREAHLAAQKTLAESVRDTETALLAAQNKISELSATLREKFLLKISINTDEIDAVWARIKLPTESYHTIHVIEDRSRIVVRDGNSYTNIPPPEEHHAGGAIQAFATGGFPRVSGQLPGYGGGDRVRALLEDGEFVLRKEAVKANGKKTIQAINDGQLQIAPIKLFNSGGAVDGEERGGNGGYSSAGSFDTGSPSDTVDALLAKLAALKKQQQADQAMEKALGVNFWPNWQAIAASDRIYDKAKQTIEANIQQAQAAEADKARAQVAANLQQKLDEQNAQYLHPSLAPMFALNQPKPLPALTANMPDIKQTALAASGSRSGGGGKTITLRFESPDGKQAVSGNFAESDAQKMMEILRMSGARTTGGMF
jgi:tape measure domain-containing protein